MPIAQKSLDRKLERILSDPSCKDFILADAKDADMAFGLAAPGIDRHSPHGRSRYRTLTQFRQLMRDVTKQGLVDIMLMSASSSEILTIDERLFDDSPVTPAVRVNDTTDIWVGNSGSYSSQPSLPFRTATIDHVQCGRCACPADQRNLGANLGLYSITFNNDARHDRESLESYAAFRLEAESKRFRHFLEVFAPNATGQRSPPDESRYVNDCIVRTLAGVTKSARPIFLKMPYFGPAAMEDLVHYDPTLIVGILGGSAGTTLDAFHMLWEAKQHGARAALFGRKINNAEDQLTFVKYLRHLADDEIQAAEAVRAYHSELQNQNIPPHRPLDEDLKITQPVS
jgi:hypothetical protein